MIKHVKYGAHEVRISFTIVKPDGTKKLINTLAIPSLKSNENACRVAVIADELSKEFLKRHKHNPDYIMIDIKIVKIEPVKTKKFRKSLSEWFENAMAKAYKQEGYTYESTGD